MPKHDLIILTVIFSALLITSKLNFRYTICNSRAEIKAHHYSDSPAETLTHKAYSYHCNPKLCNKTPNAHLLTRVIIHWYSDFILCIFRYIYFKL